MTHQPRTTIVVPTYNRYPLLNRLLRYAQSAQSQLPLLLLDSSSAQPGASVQETIRRSGARHLRFDAQTPPTIKLAEGLRQVETPYAVLWADDDLMVPTRIEEGTAFLQAHPDYSVAHGVCGLFQMADVPGGRAITHLGPYPQRSYTGTSAAQRLEEYLGGYTLLFYSVHRTAHLAESLRRCCTYGGSPEHTTALDRNDLWVELLLGCLAVIGGKAKRLDGLYLLRDSHPGLNSWQGAARNLDPFDWVTSSTFSRAYAGFAACLSEAIMQQDGCSLDQARSAVKQAFWRWLGPMLARKWQGRYGQAPAGSRLRDAARRIPGVRRTWRAVREWTATDETLSLGALRRSSCRYYGDFQEIEAALLRPLQPADAPADAVEYSEAQA